MSLGEAMVWSVNGSACVRLLDVTLLDGEVWTFVTSWLRERERERERYQRKHLCYFNREMERWRYGSSKPAGCAQIACTHPANTDTHVQPPPHTHTHRKTEDTHSTTHALSMKNDTVTRLVTFKLWIPVKICCCRLVCTHNTCTLTHPHTSVSAKRDDLEHNMNSTHWLES